MISSLKFILGSEELRSKVLGMTRKEKLLIGLGVLLVIGIGVALYPKFQSWRYMNLAERCIEQKKWREASLWLGTVLKDTPDHSIAIKHMVVVSSHLGLDQELIWWEKLVNIDPMNMNNRIGYAQSAMKKGRLDLAQQILDKITASSDQTIEFLNLQAVLNQLQKKPEEVEKYTRKSLEKSSDQPIVQLYLLGSLLQQRNKKNANEVTSLIQELVAQEKYSLLAKRTVLKSLIQFKEWDVAYQASHEIILEGQGQAEDLFVHLQLCLTQGKQQTRQALKLFLPRIKESRRLLVQISQFLSDLGQNELVEEWLKGHQKAYAHEFYYKAAWLQFLYVNGRLEEARDILQTGVGWGKNESYRLAFFARVLKAQGIPELSGGVWIQAKQVASKDVKHQLVLMNLVTQWKDWYDESNELLWDVLKEGTYPKHARASLKKRYLEAKDIHGLLRLSRLMLTLAPNDDNNKNDYVMYALLLDTDVKKAYRMADQLYEKYHGNFVPTTMYAFSLYHRGEVKESLRVIEELDSRAFDIPEVAHYYAVLLNADNRGKEAEPLIRKAVKANLLHEERALLP